MINKDNWNKLDKVFERSEDVVLDINLEYNTKILNYLEKKKIDSKKLTFVIPITDKVVELSNVESLIALIKKRVLNPNIVLGFNKVSNIENVDLQYFNIYGYNHLGIDGLKEIETYKKIYINYYPIINITNKFQFLVYDFSSKDNIQRIKREEGYFTDKLANETNEDKKQYLFEKIDIVIAKKKLMNQSIIFMTEIKEII